MTGSVLAPVRRFYKVVTTSALPDETFSVQLDGRMLRTPAKAELRLPTLALAELIAAEWNAQQEHILPASMPITRLANVAIDRMPVTRQETIAEVEKYVGTDLILVRAEEPEALVAAEAQAWDPLVAWAGDVFETAFSPSAGIVTRGQPEHALAAIRREAARLDNFRLTVLAHLGALFGSSLLSFAVLHGRLTAEEGFDLSRVDESFQESRWGIDAEAAARVVNHRAEVLAAAHFLRALGT